MQKILVHKNNGEPIYVVVFSEPTFHLIRRDKSIGSHNSVGAAVASAMSTFDLSDSRGFLAWQVIEYA